MKNISKEIVEQLVIDSLTINEVLKKLGGNNSSRAYKSFHKYVTDWEIDISHFLNSSDFIKKMQNDGRLLKLTNDSIFTENSLISRNTVKKRIIEGGLLPYNCCECGNNGEWMGKRISLILDHINGVNNDNRFENLRLLCPNCNATLDTHCKGSNKIKATPTPKIDRRTIPQNRIHLRKIKDRPSKETLQGDIDEMGYAATGRKYGVSDNTIRKWVK